MVVFDSCATGDRLRLNFHRTSSIRAKRLLLEAPLGRQGGEMADVRKCNSHNNRRLGWFRTFKQLDGRQI